MNRREQQHYEYLLNLDARSSVCEADEFAFDIYSRDSLTLGEVYEHCLDELHEAVLTKQTPYMPEGDEYWEGKITALSNVLMIIRKEAVTI